VDAPDARQAISRGLGADADVAVNARAAGRARIFWSTPADGRWRCWLALPAAEESA